MFIIKKSITQHFQYLFIFNFENYFGTNLKNQNTLEEIEELNSEMEKLQIYNQLNINPAHPDQLNINPANPALPIPDACKTTYLGSPQTNSIFQEFSEFFQNYNYEEKPNNSPEVAELLNFYEHFINTDNS